jgi:hypothetical protein
MAKPGAASEAKLVSEGKMERRKTKAEAAKAYQLAQAAKLLKLFEDANGHPAKTIEELTDWVSSPEGKAAMTYDHTPDGKIIPDLEDDPC